MASEPTPPARLLRLLGEKPGLVLFDPTFAAACHWWSGYLDAWGRVSPVEFSAWLVPRSGRPANVAWPWHIADMVEGAGGMKRDMVLEPEADARCRVLMADLWIEYLDEVGVTE